MLVCPGEIDVAKVLHFQVILYEMLFIWPLSGDKNAKNDEKIIIVAAPLFDKEI